MAAPTAVGFSGSGQAPYVQLAAGLDDGFTIAGWFYMASERSTWQTVFNVDDGTTSEWGMLQTGSSGDDSFHVDANDTGVGANADLPLGSWRFAALTYGGAASRLNWWYAELTDTSMTAGGVLPSDTTLVGVDYVRLMESVYGGEFIIGRITGVKLWDVVLTEAQLDLERTQLDPVKTTDLVASWRLASPTDTTDYSGNGNTLSSMSGASTETGPGIWTTAVLPFTDDFTGTDTDPWDITKWTAYEDPGDTDSTVEILGNEGRLYAGTASADYAAVIANGITDLQDSETLIKIDPTYNTAGNSTFFYIFVRADGTVNTGATHPGFPDDAFHAFIQLGTTQTGSNDRIYRIINDSETQIGADFTAYRTANTVFWVRLKIEDSGSDVVVSFKGWDDGSAEPSTWQVRTDTSPGALLGATGVLQLNLVDWSTNSDFSEVRVDDLWYGEPTSGTQSITVTAAAETEAAVAVLVETTDTGLLAFFATMIGA